MERVIIGVSRVMGVIAASAIVVLMLAIVADVVTRFLTGSSLPAMVELSESALIVSIFFGLAWAGTSGAHVSVTLFTDRLGKGVNRFLGVVVWGLSGGLAAWLTYATTLRAISATERNEIRMGLVQWPMWPLRWVVAVGLAVFFLVCVINLVRVLRGMDILPAHTEEEARGEAAELEEGAKL
ncbi:TRAP transporter small permease [Nesterenkonia haasae]|uniref:TRAP transporter small permease n=1 Tax=Nesterenkonia haasae TaxID=2587813 RepID=UPI00139074B2|nr:TRAP transporter small permease [Nesterenkonia haasae]